MDRVTLIVPYYRQIQMLSHQLNTWASYDDETLKRFHFIVVDDGSPEPAVDLVEPVIPISVYRIKEDVPWNRGQARNIGAYVAESEWIIQTDTDHVLPPECAKRLLNLDLDPTHWYKFGRWRVGRADETRRKDPIDDAVEFGKIREHIDSYIIQRDLFLRSPYDEDYSGCLGGGSPFLARMGKLAPVSILPDEVHLHVYTRHVIPDASIYTLDRDTSEYVKRRREKERSGETAPKNILRHPWERVL